MVAVLIRLWGLGIRSVEAVAKLIGAVAIWNMSVAPAGDRSHVPPPAQIQPLQLNAEVEVLYLQVMSIMDMQQQIDVLRRYVLTLPADPDEGY